MKKLLACVLTVFLMLTCVTSCNFSLKHEHIKGEWAYNETQHWQDVTCTWNMCDFNITSEGHSYKNGVCEVCGYSIRQQGHEFEYVATEEGHCEHMVGTTCEGTCNKSPHENYDADLFCDICGYKMSE